MFLERYGEALITIELDWVPALVLDLYASRAPSY